MDHLPSHPSMPSIFVKKDENVPSSISSIYSIFQCFLLTEIGWSAPSSISIIYLIFVEYEYVVGARVTKVDCLPHLCEEKYLVEKGVRGKGYLER